MILEEEIPQFASWLPGALLAWLLVTIIVLLVGLAAGFLIAVLRNGPAIGVNSFARTLVDTVADVFQTSVRRVGALTRLAIQESLHRMVLIAFGVFVLILLFGAWYLDTDSNQPARLYLSVVLSATSFLILLMALFLSVFSLPSDIAHRTIHTVVTKPVRASEIILGRVLGFTLVGTAMLVVTGAISYVFVVRGLSHTHTVEADSIVEIDNAPGGESAIVATGRTSREQSHRHRVQIERNGIGATDVVNGHRHDVRLESRGDEEFYVTGPPLEGLKARVPIYGDLVFRDRSGNITGRGISVGDEFTYHSYIAGGTLAAAIWRFDGIDPDLVNENGNLELELTIQVFRTHKGEIEEGVLGAIVLRNPETGLATGPMIFESQEFSADLHEIDRNLKDPQERPIDLFDDLVANGQLLVELSCLDDGQYFGMAPADAYFRAADDSFTLNFVKGYVGIWLQMVLVIAFGVMFSTFLNSAVAMLATVGMMLAGFFADRIGQLAAGETLGGGPVEAFIRILTQKNLTLDLEPGATTEVIETSDSAVRFFLSQVQMLLPDLAKLNDADFVANGFSIPADLLWVNVVLTIGYLIPVLLVSFLLFKVREVAG